MIENITFFVSDIQIVIDMQIVVGNIEFVEAMQLVIL